MEDTYCYFGMFFDMGGSHNARRDWTAEKFRSSADSFTWLSIFFQGGRILEEGGHDLTQSGPTGDGGYLDDVDFLRKPRAPYTLNGSTQQVLC